jgi:clorobiocin biosynthesis protein CloN6
MLDLDLLLVHAPSVYDFRDRDDVLFAYLSNSDSVHVSPIFEMPPVGMLAIEQHARRLGLRAAFFNVASRMLRDPGFDVPRFFERVKARWIGFDLHWLVHSHGALALAELYKSIHPEARTLFGGISSTFFHEELISYPQVDYVVRGYDTLLPLEQLFLAKDDPSALAQVPNLTWKLGEQPRTNPLSHVPRVYSAAVDWAQVFTPDRRNLTPYNLVIPQAGCEYNCRWCGGSRYFFSKYMGLGGGPARVQKTPEVLRRELETIRGASINEHTVTMIDFWHEYPQLFDEAADVFVDDKIKCVHFSLHRLPTVEKGARMGHKVEAVIELSPDSHDLEVAKASGRGKYDMAEMESFIDALVDRIHSFEIYFMIGLPKQSTRSVLDTVDYCEHLLRKYEGKNVLPFVCPMLPFLDPGSEISDFPEKYGYRRIHRTLEEHRKALVSLNWKDRLNFETEWMTRDELVEVSYEAVRRLTVLKHKYGKFPAGVTQGIVARIDATRQLLREIDAYQSMPAGPERDAATASIQERVRAYNRNQLKQVRSQQRPVDFGFARQQWFDTDEAFDRVLAT